MRDGTIRDLSGSDLYDGMGILGPVGTKGRAVGNGTLRADVVIESTNT